MGECSVKARSFSKSGAVFKKFLRKDFKALVDRKRSERVNQTLLELIEAEKEPAFLLPEVLDFVERIDREKILHHYSFTSFEIWLNQYSGLSFEENYRIRAKIAGKWIDRNDYQALFPIGMGKVYEGTHFVTAHKSPDLDTTIASFWGWIDSFAARVGDGLHIWNLPGGPPPSQIEIDWVFRDVFGPAVFTHLAKTRSALGLTSNDLMSQRGLLRKTLADSIGAIDHERDQYAVVIIDDAGFYLGDWRSFDVEGVRQVIILLSSCLRWFENSLHLNLISLFAKKTLHYKDIEPCLEHLYQLKLKDCEPAKEFTARQKKLVEDFIRLILGIRGGLECTFEEMGIQLGRLGKGSFDNLKKVTESMKNLFERDGKLIEERPQIFLFLEKTVRSLHEEIFQIRERIEKFDIALRTKSEVFGHHPTYVTSTADVEEIRNKMGSHSYLTVTYPDRGKMYPIGVIQASELRKQVLGTVSLRDFCNREEMTIPSYLQVISIIDHHKSTIETMTPPMAIIADSQSSNTLVARAAFQINDRNSSGGQKKGSIQEQIKQLSRDKSPAASRVLARLLKKRSINSQFYVHPNREFLEYLHFLYGILDDTDLLTKVSSIDIDCVISLLNRMKSIVLKKEVEIVSLDDLPRDKNYLRKAAQRILQNEDMYSLYRKVYAFREKEMEKNILLCAKGKKSNLFADTKEQNGCCRVGQTKLFVKNLDLFEMHVDKIRKIWLDSAREIYAKKEEIDLHIQMVSTVVSAESVYQGTQGKYSHKDEMWIWVPGKETALEHLKRFLASFQSSPAIKNNQFEVEFLGSNGEELAVAFKECFLDIPQKRKKGSLPIAVLRYKAGSINSRKAMISPYLPLLNS